MKRRRTHASTQARHDARLRTRACGHERTRARACAVGHVTHALAQSQTPHARAETHTTSSEQACERASTRAQAQVPEVLDYDQVCLAAPRTPCLNSLRNAGGQHVSHDSATKLAMRASRRMV
eukprot:433011-Alexandrium_andersonii.AAC.1